MDVAVEVVVVVVAVVAVAVVIVVVVREGKRELSSSLFVVESRWIELPLSDSRMMTW